MNGEERLAKVKLALGYTGSDKDGQILWALEAVEQSILNYIHHDALPAELETALIQMCASYCGASGIVPSPATGAVTSVKRGDVTTSFAAPVTAASPADLAGGSDFFGWRTLLNSFRRVRWDP